MDVKKALRIIDDACEWPRCGQCFAVYQFGIPTAVTRKEIAAKRLLIEVGVWDSVSWRVGEKVCEQ